MNDSVRFEHARGLARLALALRDVLASGSIEGIGEILHEGWRLKKKLASRISDDHIDRIYETGLAAGAVGGKLLGAGGGGFMLFYCEPHLQADLREEISLRELRIDWDREGSKVVYCE
jgi:D-glycero-alpha-D-manno-heptose-7-phosphate kinase